MGVTLESSMNFLKPGTTIEQIDAGASVEKLSKVGASAKVIFGVVVGLISGLVSAYGWAHGKADKSEIATVAAAHSSAMSGLSERVARIEGKTEEIHTQYSQILHVVEVLQNRDNCRCDK